MLGSTRSLKTYFFQILFFALAIPFVFSLGMLLFFIINSNNRIELANRQVKRSIELEILESLYRFQNSIQVILQSEELKNFLDSTLDYEDNNKEKLKKVIINKNENLDFKNTVWSIINNRGKVIYSNNMDVWNKANYSEKITDNLLGINLNRERQYLSFLTPVLYKVIDKKQNMQKKYGYIHVVIPISEIKKRYPELQDIKSIGKELDIQNFSIETRFDLQKKNNLILIYLYTLLSLFFMLFCSYIGYRIFKYRVINKLMALKARIQNEIDHSYNTKINNELESLSHVFDYYLRYSKFLQSNLLQNSQLSAAGNLAHFMAHDLRKPFSKLRFFIAELRNFSSIIKVRNFIDAYEASLLDTIDYVDHFLNEVMEAAVDKVENVSLVPMEDVVLSALSQISLDKYKVDINFEYQLSPNIMLKISRQRIIRVFINIMSNAFEAMNYKGKIWIKSKEKVVDDKLYLEIIIGNSNSFISAEYIENIFEAFFTVNKQNGTGLGLAIAKKMILLHGGNIKCYSIPDKGVEFVFFLPAEKLIYNQLTYHLPNNFKHNKLKDSETYHFNSVFENKKSVIVIDDDPLILRSWKRSLKNVNVITFIYPDEMFKYFKQYPLISQEIDFIITDYFFGHNSTVNFTEFISGLRDIYKGTVFLSSDYKLIDDSLLQKYKLQRIEKKFYSYEKLKAKLLSSSN